MNSKKREVRGRKADVELEKENRRSQMRKVLERLPIGDELQNQLRKTTRTERKRTQ